MTGVFEREVSLDPAADHWATLMREVDAALRLAMLAEYAAFAEGRATIKGEITMRSIDGQLKTEIDVRILVLTTVGRRP